MSRRLRVLQIITGLEVGGAETVLCRLLGQFDRSRFDCHVLALKDDGPLGQRMRGLGVEVECFSLQRNPLRWFQLARRIHELQPDVVQTWLYHADLLGGLAARLAGVPALIWSVRHANLERGRNETSILMLVRVLAAFSHWMPRRIVFNSRVAQAAHERIAYASDAAQIIPNGFDAETFRPDPSAREALVRELGLPEGSRLIGLVARFHPQKDHRTFLRAAARIRQSSPDARFVLCGREVTPQNARLTGWMDECGLNGFVHLLGVRDDVPSIQAALDLAVSSSSGEAFPNAIGEAMCCGVPCVVTDVGESAALVGETGLAVPREDPRALADACLALLGQPAEVRRALGAAARRRIEEQYSLAGVVRQFEQLYEAVARGRRPAHEARS